MAFGRARTNMQAAIEDESYTLKSLLHEFKEYFARHINSIRIEKDSVLKDEDSEVAATLCREFDYREDIYLEYEQEFLKMMISRVYSYAEKLLGQLIKANSDTTRKKYNRKSDIEAYFITFCLEQDISRDITDLWPDFHEFREMRKNITHYKKEKHFTISYEYVETTISDICNMLLTLESHLR